MTKWLKFDNGRDLLDAKNVTFRDSTKGCILVDFESIGIYREAVEVLNNTSDIGVFFIDSLDVKKPNELLSETDVKEASDRFNKLRCIAIPEEQKKIRYV
ncbi:hypothetical protein ABD91_01960 [Lysinibacillus sphaericus]|uniref:hypothetical protein n=2 Tax=Lysinibacillus TaxID=400634 RepID=UPI0018CCB383|nr:hypothetical protein [Lysinibacillus sphaericus]MBG9689687.1 hypothetical protein [Lysinibacillus sphaericus]